MNDNIENDTQSDIDGEIINSALDDAITKTEEEQQTKATAMKEKARAKRKKNEKMKRDLGIRTSKQSKFSTQSDDFLGKSGSDAGIHVILNQQLSKIYIDGADFAPRLFMGIPAFNKQCKKNAFEHLMRVQEKLRKYRGDDPANAPKWIIISNDTSMIQDRNIMPRLNELKDNTQYAAAFGYAQIRSSGKWFSPDRGDICRGCYIQANLNNIEWNYVCGQEYGKYPRRQILIAHGPFIAVRGSTFMQIDFSDMAQHTELGFYHYMADISLECSKRGYYGAQINTVCTQFDDITNVFSQREVQVDHAYFTSKWQSVLPQRMKK